MTVDEFKANVRVDSPPDFPAPLRALWHDARGEWDRAHEVAQEIHDATGAWIHAYLHRKEGDRDNAAYWYGQANQPVATDSLDAEWTRIVTAVLASSRSAGSAGR
jgi:hypothetical protein